MAKKFDTKSYQDKDRVYIPVTSTVNILRLFIWNKDKKEYQIPEKGKPYSARRYELSGQQRKRVTAYFNTVDEARAWQNHLGSNAEVDLPLEKCTSPIPHLTVANEKPCPTFGEIYQAFFRKKVSVLSKGTQNNYDKHVRLYYSQILPVPIGDITPKFIDDWIDWLREHARNRFPQSKHRCNFEHEISVLRSVLRFYQDYYEDPDFRFPLKERHKEDIQISKTPPKVKNLTEEEFSLFVSELGKLKHGEIMVPMATVQFYQALRISEAAALFFEDLNLNFKRPQESTIRVCRHIFYSRNSRIPTEIADGFKNAGGGIEGVKELQLFPEAFEALKSRYRIGARGLVFTFDGATPITYRQIQKAYDDSFKKAGLPYRGTHVLRHGGCRRVYNATGGDITLAQQLLGNSDLESTLVYAKRENSALRKHVLKSWEDRAQNLELVANGRN